MKKLVLKFIEMKKKELEKFLLRGVLITGMALIISGCSNKGANPDSVNISRGDENNYTEKSFTGDEGDLNYQSTSTDIKVSELFNDEEKRIWFYMHELAYDEDISAIYVMEKGKIKTYKFYDGRGTAQWQPTLEDLDEKSDKEIIEFIEEKKEYINEELEIRYTRDSTGNEIEQETIHIGTGTLSLNFDIESILDSTTILSNQFLGFRSNEGAYLITKYNFEDETKIIFNEIGDDEIIEK